MRVTRLRITQIDRQLLVVSIEDSYSRVRAADPQRDLAVEIGV